MSKDSNVREGSGNRELGDIDKYKIGVDECGYGSAAGPVTVCAAFVVPTRFQDLSNM
jgi:ribonuclease HIII